MSDRGPEKPYAMTLNGRLYYIGMHTSDSDCWRIAWGWPSDEEIEEHKRKGYKVQECRVRFAKDDEK